MRSLEISHAGRGRSALASSLPSPPLDGGAEHAAAEVLGDGAKAVGRALEGVGEVVVPARELPLLRLELREPAALRRAHEALVVVVAEAREVVRVHAVEVGGGQLEGQLARRAARGLEGARPGVDLAHLSTSIRMSMRTGTGMGMGMGPWAWGHGHGHGGMGMGMGMSICS